MGIPEFSFAELLTRLPEGGAVVTFDGTLSSAEIPELASRAAGGLAELGVRPGDRLAVMLHNQQAMLTAWFGSAWAGVTFTPINTRLRGDILKYTVEHGEPALLIVADDLVATVRELCPNVHLISATDWMGVVHGSREHPMTRMAGPGCIFYTSGTTGRPKGVAWHSVTQARHAWFYSREIASLAPGEVGYTGFPLFHIQSMGVGMACLLNGATAYIDPRFSASAFWARIRETRANMFTYMGSTLAILLKAVPGRRDRDHHLRLGVGGAATQELWRAFEERFGVRLVESYGQTEMGACWSVNPAGSGRPGSVGPFCDRAEIRLEPLEEGSSTALLHVKPRGPHLMMEGYYRDPQTTASVLSDGWYNSRDLLRCDDDGWLYFAGRLTDSIRRRGENISAHEIERVVGQHPDILEVAVVGEASDLAEQEVALYYVRRSNSMLDARNLAIWCRAHLSDFMVPRYYREVTALPKTANERVQKAQLRATPVVIGFDAESGTTIQGQSGR
ncbi:crotonobetaine/carnitine-CoA ligase [Bradyrhizobium japonicum]